MTRNTSVVLGDHFEEFAKQSIDEGRYKNISEVIRAGLRLLEDEELKHKTLKNAIIEGIESGVAVSFDPEKYLKELKRIRLKNA